MKFNHLTLEQRIKIKKMLDTNYKKTDIAKSLSIHISTIYRELERGSVNGVYDPYYSEDIYQSQLLKKGVKPICSIDRDLADYIADLILKDSMSAEEVMFVLHNNTDFKVVPKSKGSLYSAIDNGFIPGVTRDNLKSNTTTVFSNGSIHISKWVRELMKINDGDKLSFKIVDDTLVFKKVN